MGYGGYYGGYYGVPVYGRQYINTIYGGTSTIYAGYAGSAVYGGGIYGAPVYGGVYGGGAAASVEEDRCSPTIQCSCDTECPLVVIAVPIWKWKVANITLEAQSTQPLHQS